MELHGIRSGRGLEPRPLDPFLQLIYPLNSTNIYPKPGRTLCFAIETKCLIPVHLSGDHAYLTLTVNPRVGVAYSEREHRLFRVLKA